MKKRSRLLTVISILVIIGGIISLASSLVTLLIPESYEQSYALLGMNPPSLFYRIYTTAAACAALLTGITGIRYRSRKSVLIFSLIYICTTVGSIILSFTITGFSALAFIDLIIPILYLWGWYLSE